MKIKECPFCGIIPHVTISKLGRGQSPEAYIYHNGLMCQIEIKTRIYKKPESAIRQWNRRWVHKEIKL